jgi:hypothetical protein
MKAAREPYATVDRAARIARRALRVRAAARPSNLYYTRPINVDKIPPHAGA